MKYTAYVDGHSWARGPSADFDTFKEAREYILSYGTTADRGTVRRNATGTIQATFRRDPNGDGARWYRTREN